jgi:hypothetical protein
MFHLEDSVDICVQVLFFSVQICFIFEDSVKICVQVHIRQNYATMFDFLSTFLFGLYPCFILVKFRSDSAAHRPLFM